MFLDVTRRRNPALIETAIALHADGSIPSNCYVLDLDAIARNADRIAAAAAAHGLACFQMTKQFGRNPLAAQAIAAHGIAEAVAVDADEALVLAAAGVRLGNVGHLVQPPARMWQRLVSLAPRFATVYSVEQAELVSRAAEETGVVQNLLLRVVGPEDLLYPAQRGGIGLADLERSVERITALAGVSVVGVTAFPCLLFDDASAQVRPTPNLATLGIAAETLRRLGFHAPVVDAPSANCIATMGTVASAGATHVEPGSSLIGNTPLHAVSEQPEEPAMVYVTEVTHCDAQATFSLGGGHYPRSRVRHALVATAGGQRVASAEPVPAEAIDYYGSLVPPVPGAVAGDTVVYAFRSQVFVSRASVAAVEGIGTAPRVRGLFSAVGELLGGAEHDVAPNDRERRRVV